jgi:hypothetical protein
MQTGKYLFLTKIKRLVNCEMIVKTKPFQWPLISLHSKVKPKPVTKFLVALHFLWGYIYAFLMTREMPQMFMKFVDLYFPLLDHVLPYNYYMLTNVLWFFLL